MEASEWRGPNIEDGRQFIMHNSNINGGSLSKISKAGGAMREMRRWSESLCIAQVVTNPSINMLEGVAAHRINFLIPEGRCPYSAGVGLDTICWEETRRPRLL